VGSARCIWQVICCGMSWHVPSMFYVQEREHCTVLMPKRPGDIMRPTSLCSCFGSRNGTQAGAGIWLPCYGFGSTVQCDCMWGWCGKGGVDFSMYLGSDEHPPDHHRAQPNAPVRAGVRF
jgi:hypothetical protein